MLSLWRWQFTLAKSELFFIIPGLCLAIVWGVINSNEFKLPFVLILYAMLTGNRLAFLKQGHYHLLIHAMPIARPQFVKSCFTFSLLQIFCIVTVLLPIQVYLMTNDLYLILMGVSFSIIVLSTAIQHYFVLTDEAYNITTSTITLSIILMIPVTAIPQLCISTFLTLPLLLEVLLLPILSLLVYMWLMQMTLKSYEQRKAY